MEIEEIIRIQKNVLTHLTTSDDTKSLNPRFIDVLLKTLPKSEIISLEQNVIPRETLLQIIKATNVREQDIGKELGKRDYSDPLHETLLKGVEVTNALDLELILKKFAGKTMKEILDDLEEDKKESQDIQIYSTALGFSDITPENVAELLPARIGMIYEALNEVNKEFIAEVDEMPLGKLLQFLHDEELDISPRELYGYVWGCVVNERPARKIPIANTGNGPIIFTALTTDMETNARFTYELYQEVKKGWIRELAMADMMAELERKNEAAEEKRRREAEQEKTKYDNLKRQYDEAKRKIQELEKGGESAIKIVELQEQVEQLRTDLEKAEREVQENFAMADEFSEEPTKLEGQLIIANERIKALEERLPDEKVTVDERPYYIDDEDLKTKIERKGIHYEMACTILGAGFKMFRFKRLQGTNIRKNTYGSVSPGLKKEFVKIYDLTFNALVRVKAINPTRKDVYQVQNSTEDIDDVHIGKLVQALLDRKQENKG
ncbi:hypothetical protein KY326_01420 [Candidatus Woesearchaeota archaeon]|nr:hypothetical protein [Candidatus Woesearchaeota archaeon]